MAPLTADRPLRWGLLGTGRVAHDFAAAIYSAPNNEITLVAGRSPSGAQKMASIYGGRGTTREGTDAYQELVESPDVDVVYVGTYQRDHAAHVLLCLRHGKHVVCEKPMCMTASEARQCVAEARKNRVLLVEGHWTHCWPAARAATRLIQEEGKIGEVQNVTSDFSFPYPTDPSKPEFQNAMGGGATMLVGVYPLCMVMRHLGKPLSVQAAGITESTSKEGCVDTSASVVMKFDGGKTGVATYGWKGEGRQETVITGDKGFIILNNPAHAPIQLTLVVQAGERNKYTTEVMEFPMPKHPEGLPPIIHPHSEGFLYEVQAVEAALRAGHAECESMPMSATVHLAETVDKIRMALGVHWHTDSRWPRLLARMPATAPTALAAAVGVVGAGLTLVMAAGG